MNAQTFSISGREVAALELPKEIFAVKAPASLLAQAVRVYLANQRAASAHTKTRGQVQGSTRKIFKQKGTGRARHGSVRAPIFVGGGIAHGPDGTQNYTLKMPAKMSRLALLGALSQKAKSTLILKNGDEATGKTKQASGLLNKMVPAKKALLVTSSEQKNLKLAFRNIKRLSLATVSTLNAYQVIIAPSVIFTAEALSALQKKYVA